LAPARHIDAKLLWAHYERKPQKAKDEAARRLKALVAVEGLVVAGHGRGRARELVAAELGEHATTVYRWAKMVEAVDRADWLPALVASHCGRTVTAPVAPEAWAFLAADYLRRGKDGPPTFEACFQRLQRAADKHGWTVPSAKTLKRKLEREVPKAARVLARHGTDALDRLYPAQERDHEVFHALEAINGDGYTFEKYVKWPDGTVGRPCGWAWQDIYSSKILAIRLDQTENADMLRLSYGDVVESLGIPRKVWIDNTRAAANKWMTGGTPHRYRWKVKDDDPLGVFPLMGSKVHWATPAHGQAKPVERIFGIGGFHEFVDRHPQFEGRGTMGRPVPHQEFLDLVLSEIAAANARTGRRGKVQQGRSFDECFAESYATAKIPTPTEAQQRLWMLVADKVMPDRTNGSFKMYGGPQGDNRYWHEALTEFTGIHRRPLVVRFDPENLKTSVHVYTLDGRYLCEAPCVEAAGFDDTEAARAHARAKGQFKKAAKASLAAVERMSALEAAALLPKVEGMAPPKAGVVEGLFTANPTVSVPRSPEVEAAREALVIDLATVREPDPYEMGEAQRYRYWRELERKQHAGEALSERQQKFFTLFQRTDTWRCFQEVESTGAVAL
jgi:hypothetical protein